MAQYEEAPEGYKLTYGMPDDLGLRIGKRVAAELRRRKWSQGQLAAKAHCSQPVISELVAGKTRDPRASLVIAIAAALDLEVGELLAMPRASAAAQTESHLPAWAEAWMDRAERQLQQLRDRLDAIESAPPARRASQR